MRRSIAVAAVTILIGGGVAHAQNADVRPQPVPPPDADIIATAQDLPDRFQAVKDGGRAQFGDRVCPAGFADPRTVDVTDVPPLSLVRSTTSSITAVEGNVRVTRETAYGDYWVDTPNRYGIELGQALRIDCVTGAPIGIVARFPEGS